jgi:hypothetical protein
VAKIKESGRVYNSVIHTLRQKGLSLTGIGVATLCRGADHLIVQNGSVIGEYNHVSKRLWLYESKEPTETTN